MPVQDITQIGFDYNARGFVLFETLKLPVKPLSLADDGGDEVLESLSLHRHRVFESFNRVVSSWKCSADHFAAGIEGVGLLFPRIDDDGNPVHVKTGSGRL